MAKSTKYRKAKKKKAKQPQVPIVNRKTREQIFATLPKSSEQNVRYDAYGNQIDFFEFNKKTERGWVLTPNLIPVHWSKVCKT